MAQQLNATTQGIQSLRANAEAGINDSVNAANNAMAQIAAINNQLKNNGPTRRRRRCSISAISTSISCRS